VAEAEEEFMVIRQDQTYPRDRYSLANADSGLGEVRRAQTECREQGFEPLMSRSGSWLAELEKARNRADRESIAWRVQVQVAEDAMDAAQILEASAEEEALSAAKELNILELCIDRFIRYARDPESEISAGFSLATMNMKLQALREREIEARMRLQICRKQRELQSRVLEHSKAALKGPEERISEIGEAIVMLENNCRPH
jgi:hypothetical protein